MRQLKKNQTQKIGSVARQLEEVQTFIIASVDVKNKSITKQHSLKKCTKISWRRASIRKLKRQKQP